MKTTILALFAALALSGSMRAETPDPMPVVEDPMPVAAGESEDGRYFAGIFDFVRPKRATCPDGNCAPGTASAPVAVSAPVSTVTYAPSTARPVFTPIRTFASRFRARFGGLWFPGKAVLSSLRGDCGCGSCP